MTPGELAQRDAVIERLAQSRAEISRLLEPAPEASGEGEPGPESLLGDFFPRSRTLQALMSGRGLGALGALLGGLLLARPALAWRLVRLLPASAVGRMLLARILGRMRGSK